MNAFMRKSFMAENELKILIEKLKGRFEWQNAEKTHGETQRDLAEVGRRGGTQAHRTRTQCFCSNN